MRLAVMCAAGPAAMLKPMARIPPLADGPQEKGDKAWQG
jgi:hypothetical protein